MNRKKLMLMTMLFTGAAIATLVSLCAHAQETFNYEASQR
jgi:hypothetical protein